MTDEADKDLNHNYETNQALNTEAGEGEKPTVVPVTKRDKRLTDKDMKDVGYNYSHFAADRKF